MKRSVPMAISLILLIAALMLVGGMGKPPGSGASHRAQFEFQVLLGGLSTDPPTPSFEAYDYNWEGNQRDKIDWSSGRIQTSTVTDFSANDDNGNPLLDILGGTFSSVEIESFNRNLKRPFFCVAFRGPREGEMYCVSTHNSDGVNVWWGTIVSMTYHATGLGSWTVVLEDTPVYDISETPGGSIGLIGRIDATLVITRVERIQ